MANRNKTKIMQIPRYAMMINIQPFNMDFVLNRAQRRFAQRKIGGNRSRLSRVSPWGRQGVPDGQ